MRCPSALVLVLIPLIACRREEPAATSPAPPATRRAASTPIGTIGGLQAQRTDVEGIVADLLSATREEGRLAVSVRFRNAGTDSLAFAIPADGGSYPGVRLVAAGRTWPIAREPDGGLAAPDSFDVALAPGQSRLWRAEFVAPPRATHAFDLEMPGVRPFTDVPITDEPSPDGR